MLWSLMVVRRLWTIRSGPECPHRDGGQLAKALEPKDFERPTCPGSRPSGRFYSLRTTMDGVS
jgi:hypothetical protein